MLGRVSTSTTARRCFIVRKRGPYASRPRGWRLVLQDWSITLGILLLCTLIGFLFLLAGHSESNMISVYILGVLVIASATSHKNCFIL